MHQTHEWCGSGIDRQIIVILATIIKVLFAEMYAKVVFVIRCLYSAVSLTLVKEQHFIKIIYYYYYYYY